jgi:hypothetical protein
MNLLRVIGLWGLPLLALATIAQTADSSKQWHRIFKHNAKFISVYDKVKDQTVVIMEWYGVSWPSADDLKNSRLCLGRAQCQLDIQAAFGYSGRSIKSIPASVQFEIRVKHPGMAFFKSTAMPELKAKVDREIISLGPTSLELGNTFVDLDVGQVSYERLSASFTFQGLQRLIEAKTVTMTLGDVRLSLEDRHLEALRDLSSRMSK